MRQQIRCTLAAVVLAAMAMPNLSLAQPGGGRGFRGGPGGPGGGMLGLLLREEVRQELQLVDEQQAQLETLADDIRSQMQDRMRNVFGQMRDLTDEERRARFDEVRAEFEQVRTEAEARLKKVLLPHQMERLRQIDLQVRMQQGGARAFEGSELVEALGLTPEQQEQLRERAAEVQQEMQQEIVRLRAEARQKLLEVLTPEQRAKLDTMMGEQFDLPDGGRGNRFRNRPGGQMRARAAGPPPPAEQAN